MLGACNLRDIGHHFPDTDAKYKDADSLSLLREVTRLLADHRYSVSNIDSTVLLEEPKVNPHVPEMQKVIAASIGIESGDVSIKATTNEKMGPVGRGEGVTAYAVVLINRIEK